MNKPAVVNISVGYEFQFKRKSLSLRRLLRKNILTSYSAIIEIPVDSTFATLTQITNFYLYGYNSAFIIPTSILRYDIDYKDEDI